MEEGNSLRSHSMKLSGQSAACRNFVRGYVQFCIDQNRPSLSCYQNTKQVFDMCMQAPPLQAPPQTHTQKFTSTTRKRYIIIRKSQTAAYP